MTTTDLQAQLEDVARSLVMLDPDSPLSGVASVRDHLRDLADELRAAGWGAAAVAADNAAAIAGRCVAEDSFSETVVDALGRAIEALQEVLEDLGEATTAAVPPLPEAPAAPTEPEDVAVPEGLRLSSFVEDAIAAEFISRQADALADIQSMVLGFEGDAPADEIDSLKRWFHTLKGESGLLGLDLLAELCHVAEDMIQSEAPADCVDRLLEAFDWMQGCFDFLAKKGPVPPATNDLLATLRQPAPRDADPVEDAGKTAEAPDAPTPPASEPVAPAPPAPAPSSLPPVEVPSYTEKNLLSGDVGLLQDFIAESNEHLDAAEAHLLTIEGDPRDEEALNAVFRGFHTIKGLAGFAELDAIQELAHKAENLLDMGRKGDLELSGVYMDLVFESVDLMKRLVEGVAHALSTSGHQAEVAGLGDLLARLTAANEGTPVAPAATAPEPEPESASPVGKTGFVPLGKLARKTKPATGHAPADSPAGKTGFVPLANMARRKADPGHDRPAAAPAAPAPPAATPTASAPAPASGDAPPANRQSVKMKEAVRVDAERLDRLIETIGEMVIAESMVSQNPEIRRGISVKLAKDLDHLDKISRELQEIGMSLRMVPVRPVFQKMARLVRDLAKKTGRKVEFVMSGEDTELDKNVVDRIGDPLVHMVRNAVDHGLEPSPADRVAVGKAESGRVELRAYHKGGNICIEVADDGRGLPKDKILQKAVDRGIVKESDQLSDREIHNLIFEPGFSTASQVTDISGRGVGMDVVRRNIEELRGTCEITSQPGAGSTFSIKLPLTLAIIEGMVISCGPEHYIVPTLSVVRLVRLRREDVFKVFGRGEMMAHEDEHIPLFRLGRLFEVETAKSDIEDAVVVVVEEEGLKIGVLADDLLGQQSIVIKSLGESMQDAEGVAGGAIMSNGNVALILDVAGLIKVAHGSTTHVADAAPDAAGEDD